MGDIDQSWGGESDRKIERRVADIEVREININQWRDGVVRHGRDVLTK